MNLQQLIAKVYTITNRPDMVDETLAAIIEATQSIHTTDNFYKDIKEAMIVFDDPTLYIQQLDISTIPFYRNMSYIKKFNPILTFVEQTNNILPAAFSFPDCQFDFLEQKDIGTILDRYGYELRDIWYQAGKNINMKSSTPMQYAKFGWYAYPNIGLNTDGSQFSSWVADECPYTIIYKAAGQIFANIGEDKSWAIYMKAPTPGQGLDTGGLFYQQLDSLISNNLSPGA